MLAAKANSVDDLKKISAETLAAMNDEQLAYYLSDITNLEPKALPLPLGTEEKVPKIKKAKSEKTEDLDGCPIKSTTKDAKQRAKLQALLADLNEEIK